MSRLTDGYHPVPKMSVFNIISYCQLLDAPDFSPQIMFIRVSLEGNTARPIHSLVPSRAQTVGLKLGTALSNVT